MTTPRARACIGCLVMGLWCPQAALAGGYPFAAKVVDYSPAPGQFVNHPLFNDPTRALGPPVGGGTGAADNTSVVTLGGFGGSITLGFDQTVMDHPANPFGMDFIVFGNGFWFLNDPGQKWCEAAYIEISRDINGNGIADDPWYLIPGSHLWTPADHWQSQTWDDDYADPTYPPASPAQMPPGQSGTWTTWAYRLPPEVFEVNVVKNPHGPFAELEGVFGYADCSPTLLLGDTTGDNVVNDPGALPEVFYTFPDNPYVVGITPGSGGGDAFDIAWAIDPVTGAPAHLEGFDFIRITTGVNKFLGPLGEMSAEVDAVAVVAPGVFGDVDADGDIDAEDFAFLVFCLTGPGSGPIPIPCRMVDFDWDDDVDLADAAYMQVHTTGP